MPSVLIAHSYFLRFDQKQLQRAKPYPPLATLQVAAAMRASGHRVSMFDAMLAADTGEYERCIRDTRPQLALFYEDNFNYLSKMCLSRMREATFEMIASARSVGARIIVAGSDASDAPAAYLAAGAEVVLIGEGLTALRTLLLRLDHDLRMPTTTLAEGLSDVAFRDDSLHVRKGKPHPEQEQPGMPAWDLVDVERYRAMWLSAHGYFSLNMTASRGCSFRCNWCAKPIWGNRYLQRATSDVAAEMAYLKRELRPDHIWFADDIFGFRVDWVREFSRITRALDGQVPFTIQTRPDLISVAMAQALAEAGCREAWIGAESGSQRVLDAMNKGTRVADILTATTRLRAAGIRVGFFIQLGYLSERLEDIVATRTLVEDARPDDVGVSVAYPLPGTKFYDLVKEQLHGRTHWRESNDLAMMFEGTYTSEFYRAVRDLLHDQVTAEQSARASGDLRPARELLERRWQRLLTDERQFRNATPEAALPTWHARVAPSA
jgi:anaerobic magnesium-protoporphyrin IX monomethyl ester cyclase